MTARIARWSLLLLMVFLLAAWLPALWEMLFGQRFGKTQLFYSPVIERFVYTELRGAGHQFTYRDQDGNDYRRKEFEALIPFIYYKNMELWGRLPLTIDGQQFDKAAIRAERQVLELKPTELPDHRPRIPLYPLFEANPGQAQLRFPEDVVRPGERLVFIDSDANRSDPVLTERFTEALRAVGFRFPVRATFARVSILKPFDAGHFLVDDGGALFQLRRVDDRPAVRPVPLPEGLAVRHIKVAENSRREVLALLLAEDGRTFLLGDGAKVRLIPLALPGYAPERMELKLLFDPLYRTAVYADQERIRGVVMDRDYVVLDRYARTMAMAEPRLADRVFQALAPFHLTLREPTSRSVALTPAWHPAWAALLGSALALLIAIAVLRRRGLPPAQAAGDLTLVALTGLYGLVAVLLLPPSDRPSG